MTASPPDSSRRLKYAWGAAAAVILLVLYVAFTRHDAAPAVPAPSADSQAQAKTELQRQLKATLDGLRPERLYVSANVQDTVGDLNLWWAGFSEADPPQDAAPYAAAMQKWLGDAAAANASAERFSVRDAVHIRNALLYRAMAAALVATGKSQREIAVAAFETVTRNVALLSSAATSVPIDSGEVLLAGRGTPEDRIWILAEVLRQLGIDVVVLEPATAPEDAAMPARLVGVVIKGEGVLLFDPQMGLPVPPVDDTAGPLPTEAATVAAARQNDAIFRQFDVPDGPKYPWTAELLKSANVRFILDSTYAAGRMRSLQIALPSDYGATLFDGPADSGNPSLEERIVAAGQDGDWMADSVSAWSYPEQQLTAYFAVGSDGSEDAKKRLATLSGPRVLSKKEVNDVAQLVEEDSPQPLRVIRVEHLRGNLNEARRGYGVIREARPELSGNVEVREDAVHWVAVVQMDLQRYDLAVSELQRAQKNYRGGIWSAATAEALPRCEALRGDLQRAIELAAPAADQKPKLSDAYLLRRWQAQSAAAPTDSVTPPDNVDQQ
ncbi:MAG: hypothetical protein JNG89_06490 [Planctomycetaceae bacterium]|nr:hypothetical protein [Planctomycetaceae bacterium]